MFREAEVNNDPGIHDRPLYVPGVVFEGRGCAEIPRYVESPHFDGVGALQGGRAIG